MIIGVLVVRLIEFASAEEQIALFKLITDKVWQSLADQKKQQEEQAAQQRRAAKVSGGSRGKRGVPPKQPAAAMAPPQPKPQAQQPRTQQPALPTGSLAAATGPITAPTSETELTETRFVRR
jgi:hypothetical protein